MKKIIIILMFVFLFISACEKKETNPQVAICEQDDKIYHTQRGCLILRGCRVIEIVSLEEAKKDGRQVCSFCTLDFN